MFESAPGFRGLHCLFLGENAGHPLNCSAINGIALSPCSIM